MANKQKSEVGSQKPDANPWEVHWSPGAITCSSEDRIHQIKDSTDLNWLKRVLAWKDNQLTVRQAAERRIRQLQKLCASAPLR